MREDFPAPVLPTMPTFSADVDDTLILLIIWFSHFNRFLTFSCALTVHVMLFKTDFEPLV